MENENKIWEEGRLIWQSYHIIYQSHTALPLSFPSHLDSLLFILWHYKSWFWYCIVKWSTCCRSWKGSPCTEQPPEFCLLLRCCARVTGRKGVKSNVIYSGFFPDIPWVSTVRAHKIEGTNTHNVAIALVENRRMRRTSKQWRSRKQEGLLRLFWAVYSIQ